MITSRQQCATLFTGCPCLSALRSKLRWWYMTASMADHQCTSATSVHRTSPFPFVLGFALLTTMTWLYHVLGPRVMVRAVSASRHLRFGTRYHLISRTVMLVANSSSRALRLGCLCKPTHKGRLWELCLSGALQILDLIDWLIDVRLVYFRQQNPHNLPPALMRSYTVITVVMIILLIYYLYCLVEPNLIYRVFQKKCTKFYTW